jgi:hypothetical protein
LPLRTGAADEGAAVHRSVEKLPDADPKRKRFAPRIAPQINHHPGRRRMLSKLPAKPAAIRTVELIEPQVDKTVLELPYELP